MLHLKIASWPSMARGRHKNPAKATPSINSHGQVCPTIPQKLGDGAWLHPSPASSPSGAALCAWGLLPTGKVKVLEPPELRRDGGGVRFNHTVQMRHRASITCAGGRRKPLRSHPGNPWKHQASRSRLDLGPELCHSQLLPLSEISLPPYPRGPTAQQLITRTQPRPNSCRFFSVPF